MFTLKLLIIIILGLHSVSFGNNSKLSKGMHVCVHRHFTAIGIRALKLIMLWVYILNSAERQRSNC